jgi:hypothetical protein
MFTYLLKTKTPHGGFLSLLPATYNLPLTKADSELRGPQSGDGTQSSDR